MATEGNAYSQLLALMKQKGYNKDVDVGMGVVKKNPPDLLIVLERNGLELDKTDCILTHTVAETLKTGDRVILIRDRDKFFIMDKAVIFE